MDVNTHQISIDPQFNSELRISSITFETETIPLSLSYICVWARVGATEAANVYRILHVKLCAINADFMRGKVFACVERHTQRRVLLPNLGRLEVKFYQYKASPARSYGQGCVIYQET